MEYESEDINNIVPQADELENKKVESDDESIDGN